MELLLDLTKHAVVGLVEVLKNYGKFRRIFWQLVREAEKRQPDAVVLVDFPGFNLRFAAQMKKARHQGHLLHLAATLGMACQPRKADRARRGSDAHDLPV